MKLWKRFLTAGAAGVALSIAVPASAVVIPVWTAEFLNGFDNFTGGTVAGVGASYAIDDHPTVFQEVAWGIDQGNGLSSLEVTKELACVDADCASPGTAVQVVTDAAPVQTITLTHNNVQVTITSGTLETIDLVSQLTLFPGFDPAIPPPVIDENTPGNPRVFNVKFKETNNFPAGGDCGFPVDTQCDDVFVLLNPEDLVQEFIIADFIYTLTVGAVGGVLQPLGAATCAQAGEGANCIGFTTPEFQSTNLPFNIQITARQIPVPEPGSLALMGLALLGLGFARRRAG